MNKQIKRASVSVENNLNIVRINSSGMSLLRTCERKADWVLLRGFGAVDTGSPAANFGTLIHKALASYYQLPRDLHTKQSLLELWASVSLGYEFGEDQKRSRDVGMKMLSAYADKYWKDPWTVVHINGKPAVELEFEHQIADGVLYFGTIDLVVQHEDTREYAIMDHKTSSVIGKQFMNNWKPNHQMTGYIWALNEHFGKACNHAIINGLQCAKTVQNISRIDTYRTKNDIEEFKEEVICAATRLLKIERGTTPRFADGNVCSQWSGCRFKNACATDKSFRDGILEIIRNKPEESSDAD